MSSPNPPPFTDSQSADSGATSGVAGTGAQARSATAAADTTADIGQSEAWLHNLKRLVEEFMHIGLEGARQHQALANRVANNAVSHDEQLRNVAVRNLDSTTETANLAAKQALRHSDIAIDRQWNIDEQNQMATIGASVLSEMAKRNANSSDMAEIIRGIVASELAKMSGQGGS